MRMIIDVCCLVLLSLALTGCNVADNLSREANEQRAKKTLAVIHKAQREYAKRYGKNRYGNFDELAKENLVSAELKDGEDSGYKFNIKTENEKYSVQAIPIGYGSNETQGMYSFYLDESGVIRVNIAKWAIAGPNDPPVVNGD